MNISKKPFTLLETLIALSLLTLILTAMFTFFRQISTISALSDLKEQEAFNANLLDSRLQYFFSNLTNENSTAKDFFFYVDQSKTADSTSRSLVFTFNNGAKLDPNFAGDILARLFVNNKQELCLATWPIYAESPATDGHFEVLKTGVSDINFKLYSPPAHLDKNFLETNEVDPNKPLFDHWYINFWPLAFNKMPAILKIEVILVDKTDINQTYAFVLPTSKSFIYYPE